MVIVAPPRALSEHAQSRADGPKGQLNRDPLDFIQSNLVLPTVVELRRARRLVVGDVLRGFERALVLQVGGNTGRPERMVSDPGLDAGAARPPLDHAVGVLLPQGLAGERARLAHRRLEQRRARISRDAGGGDVFVEVLLQTVVTRNLMLLAAFLVQAHPAAAALYEVVADLHLQHSAHAGKGVDHHTDQAPGRVDRPATVARTRFRPGSSSFGRS